MKKLVLLSAIFLLAIPTAHAQKNTALIHHRVVKSQNNPLSMGRDFWFAAPSNQWGVGQTQTYIKVYITASHNTTAYVSSQYSGGVAGYTAKVPVTAYVTSTYTVPEFWEVELSGVPENKAIHVYSNDADLSVYFLSNQYQSGDGSYIIPTIGWGTDYVVAAYGSLYASSGGDSTYDLPSECVVVANQDNTQFTITPSCNVRQCLGGNINGDANSTIIAIPAGQTQTFTLNRGQCMQFMSIKATDDSDFDMTGTVIHSNIPVGVLGASMEPEIPAGYLTPNFVCEMMPPVRTWGETYYAGNPIQPPGESDKDYARYLFIGSQPGQVIYRYNLTTGLQLECVISNQYGIYWDELQLGEGLSSNAPFLCVWYLNSSTRPDGVIGLGDPAESILPSREQYTKTVLCQAPTTTGNTVPFDNYINVVVNINDERNVLFDNKRISGYSKVQIDSAWEIFDMPHVAPAVHTITGSDSGIGVYCYGYGFNESYAWAGQSSCTSFNSPDTIPPLVDTIGECLEAFIHVTDSGFLPGITPPTLQSGLAMIRIDSNYNMNVPVDNDWQEGSGADTTNYSMSVTDPALSAFLRVEVYDLAGNVDTITSVYLPQIDSIKPPVQNLGVWKEASPSGPPNIAYDTLYNTGLTPFDITILQLLKGDVGFTIHDSIGGPLDMSPLLPGQRRLIQIQFEAIQPTQVTDNILFGNACFEQGVELIGSGGANDFLVTSQTWSNEPIPAPDTGYVKTVTIENESNTPITFDSAWWPDQVHFKVAQNPLKGSVNSFPFTVPASPGSVQFSIAYYPDAGSLGSSDRTQGQWYSREVVASDGSMSARFDSLIGNAVALSETFLADVSDTFNCPTTNDTIAVGFTITATGTSSSVIDRVIQSDTTHFFNLIGTVNSTNTTWDPETTAQFLNPGQSATITVQHIVQAGIDMTFVDTLTAFDGEGSVIGKPLTLTIVSMCGTDTTVNTQTLNPRLLSFGPVNFQTQNTNATQKSFLITDSGSAPLLIDFLMLVPGGSNASFTFTTVPACPDTLQPGQSMTVEVDFNDSASDAPVQTAWIDIIGDVQTELIDTLVGTIANSGVKEAPAPTLNATVLPAEDGRSLEIILPPAIDEPVGFTLVNVLGERVLRSTLTVGTQTVDASTLPRGVYFYRLTSGDRSQNGKVILGE